MADKTEEHPGPSNWLRGINTVLDIYAVALILQMALMLIPHRPWFVELFSHFLTWALLPSLIILVVYVIKRQWYRVTLWSIPVLAFVILFGVLFLPGFDREHICNPDRSPACVHLKVMTYNLYGNPSGDRQPQIDLLRDSGADIIALQEVSQDSADAIESQLAALYPYRILHPGGIAGTGILSKYPIEEQEIFILTENMLQHCLAKIDVDGQLITVISAHPPPPVSLAHFRYMGRRYREIRALVEMAQHDGPTLLMGDFNLTDQSSDYRVLTDAGLHDSFRDVGWGFGITWPNRIYKGKRFMPLLRIDYIWHTSDIQALSARVGPWVISDHLPVIADLVISP